MADETTPPADAVDPTMGRPLKFQDLDELEKNIAAYFEWCELEEDTRVFKHGETFDWVEMTEDGTSITVKRCMDCRGKIFDTYNLPTQGCILVSGKQKFAEPPTITGLAIWLDCDKETIKNYAHRPDFSSSVKKAYLRVQHALELKLHDKDTQAPKVIFGLSNFEGWVNKHFTDIVCGMISIATTMPLTPQA